MEKVCNLLFELSNEDRLAILLSLDKEPMKMTHISEQLNLTSSETHRHLKRLSDEKLVRKDADGFHRLTPFGEQSLKGIPMYQFLSKHGEYFMTHTLSGIPHAYSTRIGELVGCELTNDVMVTFHDIEEMINKANNYFWVITDQILIDTYPLAREAIERGVELLLIRPKSWTFAPGYIEKIDEDDIRTLIKALRTGQFQQRELANIPVFLYMSEREVAALSFPNVSGKIDYISFKAKNKTSQTWCGDLFQYYWEKSDPAPVVYKG